MSVPGSSLCPKILMTSPKYFFRPISFVSFTKTLCPTTHPCKLFLSNFIFKSSLSSSNFNLKPFLNETISTTKL